MGLFNKNITSHVEGLFPAQHRADELTTQRAIQGEGVPRAGQVPHEAEIFQ